jgi:hypothetical protein
VRAQLGVEMAYISSRLLEAIADGSVSSVMARAVATDAVDGMMADLEQYAKCLPMTSDDLCGPLIASDCIGPTSSSTLMASDELPDELPDELLHQVYARLRVPRRGGARITLWLRDSAVAGAS